MVGGPPTMSNHLPMPTGQTPVRWMQRDPESVGSEE